MKATGIVRRIDDLGRVVIPKEIRRTMRIREGDPLEIFTNGEGGVVFQKYSLMGGLADFSGQLCESLHKSTGKLVTITDRDTCLSVAGGGRRELTDKSISPALAQIMEGRWAAWASSASRTTWPWEKQSTPWPRPSPVFWADTWKPKGFQPF